MGGGSEGDKGGGSGCPGAKGSLKACDTCGHHRKSHLSPSPDRKPQVTKVARDKPGHGPEETVCVVVSSIKDPSGRAASDQPRTRSHCCSLDTASNFYTESHETKTRFAPRRGQLSGGISPSGRGTKSQGNADEHKCASAVGGDQLCHHPATLTNTCQDTPLTPCVLYDRVVSGPHGSTFVPSLPTTSPSGHMSLAGLSSCAVS